MWAKEKEKGKKVQEAKALAQRSKMVQEEQAEEEKRNHTSNPPCNPRLLVICS